MKRDVHPRMHETSARCVCGASYATLSTQEEIVVTFCAQCHPYYTQKQQFADVEGRIDKFYRKYGPPSTK